MSETICVKITRQEKYTFLVDFGEDIPRFLLADEPPPLGDGAGPSPERLLAAAVANCLCGSLLFAFNKFKGDPGHMSARAICETGRNESNRLRVTNIKVDITLGAKAEELPHFDRALAQFEEFCTVSQSVRAGIPFAVSVRGPDGRIIKQPSAVVTN
ncbi:MAG: OsmC family protein [Candidatus Eremiobacteraeota bacterium]|nr:OsmC family protein [Candidatus Eremiobacteraeota bacterium]